MKKILALIMMFFTINSFAQLTKEQIEFNEKFIKGKEIENNPEREIGRQEYLEREALYQNVKKRLTDLQAKNYKIYQNNYLDTKYKKYSKPYREEEELLLKALAGYMENQQVVARYLIMKDGKKGYDRFMLWVKEDKFDFNIWKSRCELPFCKNPEGRKTYIVTNYMGSSKEYKIFY